MKEVEKIYIEYQQRWAMYDAAIKAGIPIVPTETCAIICAMLLVWGNTENFTHNHRLVCELKYAQKRFRIEGGGTTAVAAMREKRHFIGFELNKEYYEIAMRRIKAEHAQLTLF